MSLLEGLQPHMHISHTPEVLHRLTMSKKVYSPKTSKMVLNELRLKRHFCDAVVRVGDVEFPVHKVILCSCSPYFRAMFERWVNNEESDFKVYGVSLEIMQLVIEWMYTGSIILTGENVQDLVIAADMLLVEELVELYFSYMEDNMCPENCIGIWRFADVVVFKSVRKNAQRYILNHFEEVVAGDEFQELTVEELCSFIENDELNVKNETAVFEAVLHWTNHAPEARTADFARLLAKVRFAQLPWDFIKINVLHNALVRSNQNCLRTVMNTRMAAYCVNIDRMSSFSNPLARPRLPGAILLAIGGWSDGDPTNVMEAYDYKVNRWVNVTDHLEQPRAYHGSVFFNGSVYCIGGLDHIEHFSSMCRLDLSTHTWHEMPPMYHRRCYVSVTVFNGCIYAMGGYDGHTQLSTAEVYNPETNQWSLIAPMHEQRSDANCATLNDKIYICGGFNGTECLQTAESYSAEANQWTMIAPMITTRRGLAVIAYANHIYAVGGYDGILLLHSVEAYNPQTNSWRQVASMFNGRRNFGIEVVDDRIFVAGGFTDFENIITVESYDHLVNVWTEACDMCIFRSALSCCAISGLPNMAEYTVSRDIDDVEEEAN